MGRPEPCVLFAQTFVHSQLDEYVDEVIFGEPIVIGACEFLEQNGSSFSAAVTLLGATSPPSFALEVFVQCEGETRFRRLCQPFLYSHSSSNMLEIEQAVVTSHLVVRGSYRSLTLLIYGNTAEDLGQFNIELDLDSSLNNIFSSAEPKLEDLPPVLKVNKPSIDESISPPNALSLPVVVSDISVETKQLLLLIFKILKLSNIGDEEFKITSNVLSVASSCVLCEMQKAAVFQKQLLGLRYSDESEHIISNARQELIDLYNFLPEDSNNASTKELVDFPFLEADANQASSKELMEMFCLFININKNPSDVEYSQLLQSKSIILSLSVALLLCSGKDGCFYFVSGCGMEQLTCVFSDDSLKSGSVTLMLLGVVERATRYSVGCDGFLGWWPREDENIPATISEGYNQLLKLLLQKQSHVVASLTTYILHRLRLYEVISRYECAVLCILGGLSADGEITNATLDMFYNAKLQLKRLLHLINSSGMVEDPSPVACASRTLMVGQTEGLLSYNETCRLIASSNCSFSCSDIDSHFLALLKERGFLPLSAALLASPILFSGGLSIGLSVDVVSSLESIILSLLFCRSGLIFLLLHPDVSAILIHALRGEANDMNKEDSVPPRYASVLISKGLVCDAQDVGRIVETHLRVVSAIDRLLTSNPDSEEFLWVLWELCGLSRFECGRQTLLVLVHFPEALSVLIGALHSAKESESVTTNTGTPHLNVAIFHSASEIFEVIVTDSTASSLASWVEHAVELHRALHSSSPGSNRKDAPARLLEWIDAGVVYHKNGATGLLRYAAMLASGIDAHLTSSSLVSDSMDIDNIAGESSGTDTLVVENLGKIVFEKSFAGVTLRDSSVTQLTTALRILAFISDNQVVAASLYDEGVMTIMYAVLVNTRFMLERSSNSYDYLVDEGTECNATSDLLLERNREKSLVDLLVPCLVLLITILQKLQEVNEQHRNTKLMNALLRLHQEISPRLAACASYMSSQYPDSALGFGAVCHLISSALACWPIYGWTPDLFNSLLANAQATSLFVLGPKETCSFLFILNDLFPEEGILMWNSGRPLLTAFRKLAVGSLLGPRKEKQVNWYLQPQHVEILLGQLMPQIDQIAQLILHCAVSSLVVIHDLLQVFVIRLSCQKPENASVLLRPIISWIRNHLSEFSPAETDLYKVDRLLNFLVSLFEHPAAKPLLLKEGSVKMLVDVLERCNDTIVSDGKLNLEPKSLEIKNMELCWTLHVFKFISLICNYQPSAHVQGDIFARLSDDDCSSILNILLKLCQTLPVGRELVECLCVFADLGSCKEGRNALSTIYSYINSSINMELETNRNEKDVVCDTPNEHEWKKQPPLLSCWMKLLTSINSNDISLWDSIDAVYALSSAALRFCIDRQSLLMNGVIAVKFFFGIPNDIDNGSNFPEENLKCIHDMINCICSRITDDNYSVNSDSKALLLQVAESAKSLLMLLQEPASSINVVNIISDDSVSSNPRLRPDDSATNPCDYLFLERFGDKFLWECPETLPDRLPNQKRKLSSLESLNKRARENSSSETTTQNLLTRSLGPFPPSGPTRRDMFRQRKPNTSRPASMHVDDYVARERNVDGTNSNVIAIQRVGSTSGRPPSIHVDEFIARQKERLNPIPATESGESLKSISENKTDFERFTTKIVKPELDDDLQGIDIVFDGEESDSDDKLPFPQPDDNLPIIGDQNFSHNMIDDAQSESSASCEKKFFNNANPIWGSGVMDSSSGFSTFMNTSISQQLPNLYSGHYDRKFLVNPPPPLPPLPPPIAPVFSQPPDLLPTHMSPFVSSAVDNQLPQPTTFNVHSEYMSAFNNNSTAFSPSPHTSDLMHPRTSTSSPILSTRPPPPPPTPPHSIYPSSMTSASPYPFYPQTSVGTSEIPQSASTSKDTRLNSSYINKRPTSFPPPHPIPPPLPFNRPALNQVEGFSNMVHNFSVPLQLQPLQPPQLIRPLQPPQHPRPGVQASNIEHGMSVMQSPVQVQVQPLQTVQQQPQPSHVSVFYQSQQPENAPQQKAVENSQQDIGMSLHDYFSSPEAIQSLLKDREKLCELLEQHPKLMQMLQEKLGQR